MKIVWLLAVSSLLLTVGGTAGADEDNQPDSFLVGIIAGGLKTCLKSAGSAPEEIAVPVCACAMGAMAFGHDSKALFESYLKGAPPDDFKKVAINCTKAILDYKKDKSGAN